MKSKLKKWLKSRNPFTGLAGNTDDEDGLDRLPHLGHRRHVLTPSPSQETLPPSSSSSSLSPSDSSCRLFTSLPYEIRRAILTTAFGNRTVHIHLTFTHPAVPRLLPEESPYIHHAGGDKQDRGAPYSQLKVDRSRAKRWMWSGSVCHRNAPWVTAQWKYAWHGPWEDTCQVGHGPFCELYPGDMPGKCMIGVVGWLLTCRQAYVEGIDVLYRTNTIFLESQILIMNLSKLLLPQRLASIVSLEVSLEALTTGSNGDWGLDISHLPGALDSIASSFPCLRRLYLSIKSGIYAKGRLDHAFIIEHMDGFYQRVLPHMDTLALALPVTTVGDVAKMAEWQEEQHPATGLAPIAVWRCFDEQKGPQMHFRYLTYPKRPLRLPEGSGHGLSSGYWILEGNYDEPHYMVCF